MELSIRKPSKFLYFTEAIRATFDFWKCMYFLAFYRHKKIDDSHPIVVVPGFLGSDLSTILLRWFIKKQGFTEVHGWELGRNLGHLEVIPLLSEKVESLYQKNQQKVTLIGWSLGGVFTREIAKQKPQIVNQLITLGSPFANIDAPNNALWIYRFFNDVKKIDQALKAQLPVAAPVPTTAIYSKQDGVVPWQACIEPTEDATHENIEVKSSHLGFAVNKSVFKIIIRKLRNTFSKKEKGLLSDTESNLH